MSAPRRRTAWGHIVAARLEHGTAHWEDHPENRRELRRLRRQLFVSDNGTVIFGTLGILGGILLTTALDILGVIPT